MLATNTMGLKTSKSHNGQYNDMPPQHMHMHGLAKTNILYKPGPPIYSYTPMPPNPSNTIQFIELTDCHYQILNVAVRGKTNKYDLWDAMLTPSLLS